MTGRQPYLGPRARTWSWGPADFEKAGSAHVAANAHGHGNVFHIASPGLNSARPTSRAPDKP